MSELKLQQDCFLWFYENYPQFRIKTKTKYNKPRCLLVHNFNNPRNKVQGARLASAGLCKGVPDLTLLVMSGPYGALFIELKKPGEKPKPEQREMIEVLRQQGYKTTWTDNKEDFKRIIKEYLND